MLMIALIAWGVLGFLMDSWTTAGLVVGAGWLVLQLASGKSLRQALMLPMVVVGCGYAAVDTMLGGGSLADAATNAVVAGVLGLVVFLAAKFTFGGGRG